MKHRLVPACTILACGLAGLFAGCSSGGESNGPKGSLAITVGATRGQTGGAFTTPTPTASHDDALSRLQAAAITIAGVEARMADGTWVPVESGLPADVDLITIMNAGNGVTLPADLLPEGDYDALELRITPVRLTLSDGAKIALSPHGSGWTIRIPVSFSIVVGQSTVVDLKLHCVNSFKFFDGEFGFEPEIEVDGVEHH